METLVKHSALNPFASCFIPSSFRKLENVYTECEARNEVVKPNETTAVSSKSRKDLVCQMKDSVTVVKPKELTAVSSECLKDLVCQKDPVTVLCSPPESRDLISASEVLKESDGTDYTDIFDLRTEYKDTWSTSGIVAFLELLLLILYGVYSLKDFSATLCTDDSHKEDSDCLKKTKYEDECDCPPMFGFVIPPSFFGNPFKISYSCRKNGIHASRFTRDCINEKISKFGKEDNSDKPFNLEGKTALEQYSLEMCSIVTDVCETISKSADDWPENKDDNCENRNANKHKYASQLYSKSSIDVVNEAVEIKISPIGSKIPSRKSSCSKSEELMEIPEDRENDDKELHPLLKKATEQTENEVFIGVPDAVIGKMIESGLSSKRDLILDIGESSGNETCNPPCSFWCDSIPKPAKDTYKKFVQRFSDTKASVKLDTAGDSLKQKSLFRKSLYKRSFSANDCLKKMCENQTRTQSCFDAESRERLLLLRRDPINYFKLASSSLLLKERCNSLPSALMEMPSSRQVNDSQSVFCKKDKCSMWGQVDGADSLWKPLPDCVPANDSNSKQNNRKAREMRRQKSVN